LSRRSVSEVSFQGFEVIGEYFADSLEPRLSLVNFVLPQSHERFLFQKPNPETAQTVTMGFD